MGKERRNKQAKMDPASPQAPAWMRYFVWGVFAAAGLLALWALGLMSAWGREVADFAARGWGAAAEVIVQNKIRALWHAAFMTGCAGAFLWLFLLARPRRRIVYDVAKWALVLLVAADAWLLSRHYVKTMPLSAMDENPVVALLKRDMPVQRVALVTQEGFYNWWLTYLFPYHGIQSVNITQMPRMPIDYKNFLGAVGRNPIRYWQLAAVGYVLAPVGVWTQIQADAGLKATFELVYSYNVAPGPEGAGVTVVPASPVQPGQHVVLRYKQPGPRYALIAGWEACPDNEALQRLPNPQWTPFRRVLVAPECVTNAPSDGGAEGVVGRVESLGYRSGLFHLKTKCDRPAVLRVAEKYDPNWKVWVDGKPGAVWRVDYIFQGVWLPAGSHEVLLKYTPATWPLYVQLSGMLVALAALLWLIAGAIRKRFARAAALSPAPLATEPGA